MSLEMSRRQFSLRLNKEYLQLQEFVVDVQQLV
jgi:hypothetical protein